MKGIFHLLSMNLPRYPASEKRPDIYSQPSGDTEPFLKVVKDQSQVNDKSTGLDPYDTAKFHKE